MEACFHCYHTPYGNVEVTKVTIDRLAQAPTDVALQRELPVAGPLGTLAFLALAGQCVATRRTRQTRSGWPDGGTAGRRSERDLVIGGFTGPEIASAGE
jgi:hypothetical protein